MSTTRTYINNVTLSSELIGESEEVLLSSGNIYTDNLAGLSSGSGIGSGGIGALLTLSSYFTTDDLQEGNVIKIKSISFCHYNKAGTVKHPANDSYIRILDRNNHPVGTKSGLNNEAAPNVNLKYTFDIPVEIDTSEKYYKVFIYGATTDSILAGGMAAKLHIYNDGIHFFKFYYSDYDINLTHASNWNLIAEIIYDVVRKNKKSNIIQNALDNTNTVTNDLKGKYVSIIGDSNSTYKYYIPANCAANVTYPLNDVSCVELTWWQPLIEETGMNLLVNAAAASGRVTGADTSLTSNYTCMATTAKIALLSSNNITPDIVICYVGINDYGRVLALNVPVGDYDGLSAVPDEGTKTNFADAYAIMLNKILSAYPMAEVYCCNIPASMCTNCAQGGTFPLTNAGGTKLSQYNDKIEQLAKVFGCNLIDLYSSSGITYTNGDTTTMSDKIHLNIKGMELVKNCIKSAILRNHLC